MGNSDEITAARVMLVERVLRELLPRTPDALCTAMRWAVEGGGKRIRPLVCLAAAEAVGGKINDAVMPACAIELLHSYTLVHDDLPAMDNDSMRRGKESVWAKFGEAVAILAGDALQALAFATAALAPRRVADVVGELGIRGFGVVSGQVADLCLKRDGTANEEKLAYVYEHKTADLFVAAAAMGAIAAGGAWDHVQALRSYALNLGLAFQYRDDMLDDDSPLPYEETARRVRDYTAKAVAALGGLPGDTAFLSDLAENLVSRGA